MFRCAVAGVMINVFLEIGDISQRLTGARMHLRAPTNVFGRLKPVQVEALVEFSADALMRQLRRRFASSVISSVIVLARLEKDENGRERM